MDRLTDFGHARDQAKAEGTAYQMSEFITPMPAPTSKEMEEEKEDIMHMKEFFQQADQIAANTKKIDQLTDELDKYHKIALTTVSEAESSETSVKIDVITSKINQYSNSNRNMLKAIELDNEQFKQIAMPGSGDMRMRESKHRQLASSFLKITKRLQKIQRSNQEKYKQQIERQYKIVNPKATAEEIAKITSEEGAQAKIFASAVKEDAKKTLNQMKDRFADIKLIEKSIIELHQLFLDLQTIVVEQGDMINRVEFNVDMTVGFTEQAAEDMKDAVQYQKSIWRKKWIFIILAGVGIVVLVLLLLYLVRPFFVALSR